MSVKFLYGNAENVLQLDSGDWIVYFNWVYYMVYELYLNKAIQKSHVIQPSQG